jgi:hypothetical protein
MKLGKRRKVHNNDHGRQTHGDYASDVVRAIGLSIHPWGLHLVVTQF